MIMWLHVFCMIYCIACVFRILRTAAINIAIGRYGMYPGGYVPETPKLPDTAFGTRLISLRKYRLHINNQWATEKYFFYSQLTGCFLMSFISVPFLTLIFFPKDIKWRLFDLLKKMYLKGCNKEMFDRNTWLNARTTFIEIILGN